MRTTAAILALAFWGLVEAGTERGLLSEAACIEHALRTNATINGYRIERARDSLELEAARAAWLPSDTLAAEGALNDNDSLSAMAHLGAGQALPGGGRISAAVTSSFAKGRDDNSATNSRHLDLSLHQPLARGAWRYSSPAYALRIQRLDERRSRASFIKNLSAELSTVRTLFWSLYEKKRLQAITESTREQARRLLRVERARFRVGDIAAIDTLSAALEVLKAEQALLADRNACAAARHDLAEALALPPAQVTIPDSVAVILGDLDPAPALLARIRQFDPQRRIFSLLAEELDERVQFSQRALLPQVDLQASYRYGVTPPHSPTDNAVYAVIMRYAFPTKQKRIDVAQARLDTEHNRADSAAYERELGNRVTELVDAWANDRQALEIAHLSAEVARRYATAAEKGYEVGTVGRIEYLEARDEAIAEAIRLIQRRVLLKQAEIVFDELTGETLSRFGVAIE